MSERAREYVRLVISEGMGRRAAARAAGYAAGVPSEGARRLLERVELLREHPAIGVAALADHPRKLAVLRAAQEQASQAAAWLDALSFC